MPPKPGFNYAFLQKPKRLFQRASSPRPGAVSDPDIKDSDKEYINLAAELKKAADLLTPQLDNPNCSALSESIGQTVDGTDQLQTQIQIEMFSPETKALMDKLIESLRPSQSALYGSNPQGIVRQYCAKDTRISILEDLDSWSDNSDYRLMWMSGMAGTGKTTITYSYAKALYDRGKPFASFFCSKVDRDVGRIIPTIAHQLASLSPVFRDQLGGLLEKVPSLASSTGIPHQFEHLLKNPFKGVDQGSEDIVVLIDALDECDDPEQVGYFLDQLAQWIEGLPLKFLVTSRPEAWIQRKMRPTHGSKLAKSISLHDIDEAKVKEDIKLYLEQELASMSLSNEQLVRLAGQSGSLFIYAATVVRYIKPKGGAVPSRPRLITVLRLGTRSDSKKSSNLYQEMDQLYTGVLKNALGSELDEQERDKVLIVLKTVLCAKEPISIGGIAALCGLDDSIDDISFTLERLNSVIYAPETSGLVSVFHASFPDFMFDPERSKDLFCDPDEHNHLMAEQCFGLMKQLRFNICQLSSSCITDGSAITQEQIEDAIEPALSYACHYWAEHLTKSKRSDLCEELKDFFYQRLLFWMEVLNLKRSIARGGDELFRVISWLPDVSNDTDLTTFAEDARNFVTSFAANPISASTPHIYTSLLPFCPRSSAVFQCYWKYFQRLTEPDHRAMQLREVAALASWKHDSVLSVAYSHDGSKIAFGCINGTVGVQTSHEEASIFMPQVQATALFAFGIFRNPKASSSKDHSAGTPQQSGR
ncbi:unnamed protein product [Rhizoctonia solani]|uniref:NACHT domain-containing protein n=1 Tax=Rhizoctonia solani TaxID=456999 RepID=A0A8H3DTT9_9AGAM|nr:unnamed protein product [Rhizoctonia solani]